MREGEMDDYVSPEEFDVDFGEAAQGALEHALKSLIASQRQEYARLHDLVQLENHAEQVVYRDFWDWRLPRKLCLRLLGAKSLVRRIWHGILKNSL